MLRCISADIRLKPVAILVLELQSLLWKGSFSSNDSPVRLIGNNNNLPIPLDGLEDGSKLYFVDSLSLSRLTLIKLLTNVIHDSQAIIDFNLDFVTNYSIALAVHMYALGVSKDYPGNCSILQLLT